MPYFLKRAGGEILVNTETNANQSSPAVVALPGGGFIIAWTDGSGVGGDANFGVKAQRLDADGNKIGAEFLVNSTVIGTQGTPVVTLLPAGRFVIAWTDQSQDGPDTSGASVRAQLFELNGTRVGGEFLVNTATANAQSQPEVAPLTSGGFVVTWADSSNIGGDTSGGGIKAQIFDAAGAKVGGEILANSTIPGSQIQANVIGLPSGGFVVAWRGSNSSSGGLFTGTVALQQFDAAGAKVGTEQIVNSNTIGLFEFPTMAALGSGFVVIWSQSAGFNSVNGFELLGQRFDAAGAKVGGEFTVNTTSAGDQRLADVDALPDGGFLVTWQGNGGPVEGTNIFGQVFDSAGAKVGTEFILSSVTEDSQLRPRVDVLPSGEVVVTWYDNSGVGGDSSGFAVKAQILEPTEDGPSDITLSGTVVSETAREDVGLVTLDSVGALNGSYTYTIVSDSSGGAFAVAGDKLLVQDNALLNFTPSPIVDLRIRTTDENGNSFEKTLQLAIADTPEGGFSGGSQFLVNTTTNGIQSESSTVLLSNGGFLITWYWETGTINGHRAQIYDADGNPLGGEIEVLGDAAAALPGGGFVTVGLPPGGDGNGSGIALTVHDANGAQVGGYIQVNSMIDGEQVFASVAVLESGNVVVTWTSYVFPFPGSTPDPDIYARMFDSTGAPIGGEFAVNLNTSGGQPLSQVVALDTGGFLVTWDDPTHGGWRGQMFDASGVRTGDEFRIEPGINPTGDFTTVALTGGGFVAIWAQNFVADGQVDAGVAAQVFDANGLQVGGEILVTADGPVQFDYIDVAALEWGGFVITWSGEDASNGHQIRAQVFDATGSRVGHELTVNEGGGGYTFPSVDGLPSGGFVVSWTDPTGTGSDPSGSGVMSRIFEPNGEIVGTFANDVLNGTALPEGIFGLSGNDTLNGGDGNDILDGGTGIDRMAGGLGNDTYVVDHAGDIVIDSGGNDTVETALSGYTLAGSAENLILTGIAAINGTGNALANRLVGNAAANILNGGLGGDWLIGAGANDTLNGGDGNDLLDGGVGIDTMNGGAGNDSFVVDDSADQTIEAAGGGTDWVRSIVTYTLGSNVENLTLAGNGFINGTGNALANALVGNGGVNVLNGGIGADTMQGGANDDTYIVDNVLDRVVETRLADGGDTVQSSVSFALVGYVESLVLTGAGTINATGNALNNFLRGNDQANTLDGGAGADQMVGGLGNDTYVVDNAFDFIFEQAGQGTDLVRSSVTFGLGSSGQQLENLVLTGTTSINGFGNELDNSLTGNAGANVLNGSSGVDTMQGLAGNDTYVVDNSLDRAVETSAADGIDTVQSSVNYTLGAHVERLFLLEGAATDGTGNALANELYGNNNSNVLNGGGGADVMRGGYGDDTYIVDNAGDIIGEVPWTGFGDSVQASVSYTLAPNVENLTLTGGVAINGTGNADGNVINGNSAANVLTGGYGNDTLDGGGGNDSLFGDGGNDIMTGGAGADRFTFQSTLGVGNADHIVDFVAGSDKILLENAVFASLGTGPLAAGAFVVGTSAADASDRIIYDSTTGSLYYDGDGNGAGGAYLFATLDNAPATLAASDFLVI